MFDKVKSKFALITLALTMTVGGVTAIGSAPATAYISSGVAGWQCTNVSGYDVAWNEAGNTYNRVYKVRNGAGSILQTGVIAQPSRVLRRITNGYPVSVTTYDADGVSNPSGAFVSWLSPSFC